MMILLNFSHPLAEEHLVQIEKLAGQEVGRVTSLQVQFENDAPFLPQLALLMDGVPLSSEELQTLPILVNPPALNFIASLVLAELHGRMGYFPPIIRLRPITDSLPPQYEVAEILNLQQVRDVARTTR